MLHGTMGIYVGSLDAMSVILYQMIHDKAEKTYNGPEISVANYGVWVNHWFECAYKIAREFNAQDLYATEHAILDIIDEQKKYCKGYLNETSHSSSTPSTR